ncbi:hypothetical protein [Lysobacter silvisoli]|uniref:Glutaconyl-CoA decarboxylase subunit gamma n=1 Tax=Lysobacter silvisoli TaxID=2293254 RepID=A0A371K1T9_9GAMM|nr:hypothetical protein [Lysobacter silvisoli]RDZ27822.1 hypothetical protein DX914_01245 [Lysobacter silvisoli]
MKHTALILAAAATLALAACTKPADKPADGAAPAATTDAPAATTDAPAATDPAAAAPAATDPAAAPVAAADSVGIPECDDYLNKVSACLNDKVPADQRAMFQSGLDSSRAMWKQAAANPASKASLAQACKTTMEQAKAQYTSFGCAF